MPSLLAPPGTFQVRAPAACLFAFDRERGSVLMPPAPSGHSFGVSAHMRGLSE
jgi:hypothetical protein